MENFIYDYFIRPIWEKTGYNSINTAAYAIIAIAAVYLIYRALKGRVRIDDNFLYGALSFVLFGSTMRVVTDSIDGGVMKPVSALHSLVLDSHLWDYGYLTVTPGIYILTAAMFLCSVAILHMMKRMELLPYIGLALWIPHMALLIPFAGYAVYAIPILLLAAIPSYAAYVYFKDNVLAMVVAGQALDGAATFFVIDYFSEIAGISYFEQHVIGGAIGAFFGTFFAFYLAKVLIAFIAAHVLRTEKDLDAEDMRFVALALMIMGFAPGIRDILRMAIGA
ncbi:MAG: DUF63 family protein [Candidatus Micrarchaeota archaeon]